MRKPQVIEVNGAPAFAVIPWSEWHAWQAGNGRADRFAERLAGDDRAAMSDEAIVDEALARAAAGEQRWPAAVVDRLLAGESAVKVFREYRAMTQADLAASSGIGAQYVAQIEQGVRRGSLATLRKLAKALAVSLDHLLQDMPDADQTSTNETDIPAGSALGIPISVLPQEAADALGHYVYTLSDPKIDGVFYVGKGQKNRWFEHIEEASRGVETPKGKHIRTILNGGQAPIVRIIRHAMHEDAALAVEAALIDVYGLPSLHNEIRGHNADVGLADLAEVRERYAAEPLHIPTNLRVILLKIDRQWQRDLTPEQLLARTRKYWPGGPQLDRKGALACAVARGLIREVYRIEELERYPARREVPADPLRDDTDTWTPKSDKWGFVGTRDADFRHWIGKSVRHVNWPAQGGVRVLNF